MPQQTRATCQWCQHMGRLMTVCKPYGSGHTDGPFRVCTARCLPLAEHFGYRVLEQMEATR